MFHDFQYAARSWRRTRRVIARIEHGPKGRNPRFIVTNLEGEANELYERVYCARGDMENRIKEQQLALFADRTSSSKWWTNQYRVLLAALAYTLLETMRRTALRGTDLARAQCQTCGFRGIPITDSGRFRSLIPAQTDHRFRRKLDSDSGGEPITFSVRAGTLQGS